MLNAPTWSTPPATSAAARRRVRANELVTSFEAMPAHAPVALRVLWLADDPASDAKGLGAAVSTDPTLTTRVMRLANSAYYGLSGKVTNAAFAVTVLGFSTVRSLAAAAAAGIDEDARTPDGFWDHAALTAAAAALMAGRTGAPRHDAFSLGLLHDLGRALLWRLDPVNDDEVGAAVDHATLERGRYGIDHAEAAARVLTAWRFPQPVTDAIAHHHQPARASSPLERALQGALAVVRASHPELDPVDDAEQQAAMDVSGLEDSLVRSIAEAAERDAAALAQALGPT
jgi:putative nucleotidyltransferase with HDIG domain